MVGLGRRMLVRKDLFNQLLDLANVSVEYMNDRWITVHPQGHEKGQPLLVKEGESNKEAIDRKFGKSDKKESKTSFNTVTEAEKFAEDKGVKVSDYSNFWLS